MNPYSRFQTVSSVLSGALVMSIFGILAKDIITQPMTLQMGLSFAGLVFAAVAIWYTINQQTIPMLFGSAFMRSQVLGRYNIEGTWLQAERATTGNRISVIGVQGTRDGFSVSGYTLDENLDVIANTALEYSKLEWPFMSYKFRNTLVDAEDPAREGFGELQFEVGRGAPRRFNGYCKLSGTAERYSVEGVKLTKSEDLQKLESLEGREELADQYWELFFERDERRATRLAKRSARRRKTLDPVISGSDDSLTLAAQNDTATSFPERKIV